MTITRLRSGSINSKTCVAMLSYSGRIMTDILGILMQIVSTNIDIAILPGDAMVSRARSQLATFLLSEGYDNILWIDDDIVFKVEDVLELLASEPPYGYLVGGCYARRGMRGTPAWEPSGADSGAMVKARWCGTGFLLTHRVTYDAIRRNSDIKTFDDIVPFFIPSLTHDGRFMGEDISFCARAFLAGIQCYVNKRVIIKHRETADVLPLEF